MRRTRNAALLTQVLLASGVGGCISTAPHSIDLAANPEDSAVFAAVVRVVEDSVNIPLSIDPRPIAHVDSENFALPARVIVDDRVLSARRGALKQLGVPEGESAIPPNCWAVLAPPDQTGDSHKSGCPKELMAIAAISLPRPYSAHVPAGLRDYRAVRVPEMHVGPQGFNIITYEYVVMRAGKEWLFVKRQPTLVME